MPETKPKNSPKAQKSSKPTTADEIQSLKIRLFEAEKQIDALNTAVAVVAIASRSRLKELDKITYKQYEKFIFNTLHPMINKGNEFVHQLLDERGLLDDTK